jgi:hypothetical protein
MNNKTGGYMENRLRLAYESSRLENKNFYLGDEILAKKALGVFIDYILEKLLECPNVEHSKCSTWWKHGLEILNIRQYMMIGYYLSLLMISN